MKKDLNPKVKGMYNISFTKYAEIASTKKRKKYC